MSTHNNLYIKNTLDVKNYIQLNDILEPTNPSNGEGLLFKLSGNGGLWWKPDSTGNTVDLTSTGSGEQNTASNSGTGGVGVFKGKSGVNLEFKNINSSSPHINIIDDIVNSEIDLGFDQTQITATGILNSGSISSDFGNINIGTSNIDTLGVANISTIISGVVSVDNLKLDDNIISSININGNINIQPNGSGEVLLKSDPLSNLAAATKQYVDAIASGLTFKQPVKVATTVSLPSYTQSGSGPGATLTATVNGSINVSGIDGITSLTLGDRILVKSEGSVSDVDNGVYDITQIGNATNPWILTRSTDFDDDVEVVSGTYILVASGTINKDRSFVVSTNNPIFIDTTEIQFVEFSPTQGETNTASNSGTGGIGVFKQKVSENLEFKNINTGSSHISIIDDTLNSEIDVVFDQTQITATGVLDSGSISSGFGSIDIGTSTIDSGTITTTQLNSDNIRLDTNTLSSTNTNGDINVIPNGTGEVLLKADPVSNLGAATKQYVDASASGLVIKDSVRVTTSTSLPSYTQSGAGIGATLTASANGSINNIGIDSITDLTTNQRILVRESGSTNDTHNGVYDLTQVGDISNPWILTRSSDMDETTEVVQGSYILVTEGTQFGGSSWTISTADPITVDTNAINFAQFGISAGEALMSNVGIGGVGIYKQKTGNTFELRTINTASSFINLTLDSGNDEIDIGFDQTQITATGVLDSGSINTGFGNIDVGTSTISTTGIGIFGSLTIDETLIDNSTITLNGVTGENKIIIPVNLSDGLLLDDTSSNNYVRLITTIGLQEVRLLQNTNIFGTLTVSGLINGRNISSDGISLDSILSTGVQNLTSTEVSQLQNIDTTTISGTQWGYLGGTDQPLATTDLVSFSSLDIDQLSLDNATVEFSGISSTNLIIVPDNSTDALTIEDSGGTDYIRLISTDAGEKVEILQGACFRDCILLTDISEPPNPLDGEGKLYKKTGSDGIFWKPDSGGAEINLASGSERDIQIASSSVLTSTTAVTYEDINSMTLTTSNTSDRQYLVIFSAEFSSSFAGRTIYIIINVDGVDVATTERRVNYSNSNKFQIVSTVYRTPSIGNGIVVKVRWRYEDNKQLDSYNRSIIIDGSN